MPSVDLREIFNLREDVGKVTLREVIEASCNCNVIPINQTDAQDIELLSHLARSLNNFMNLTRRSGSRFRGERINDVGKNLENMVVGEIKKTPLEVEKLGASGYPDFEIRQDNRTTYLEIKTTGNIKKSKTHHRMFYISSGKKVKTDARHLLLQIQMEEERDKYWKVISWELRDITELKLGLKTEFNANFQDIGETVLLNSGNL